MLNHCLRIFVASTLFTAAARAQTAPPIDPEDAVAPTSIVEGAGVKVGEGTVLHPIVGMEAGVVSNVFFTDQDTVAAGLIRVLAQVGAGSLPPQRLAMPEPDPTPTQADVGLFQYRADLRLNYDYFPSTSDAVRDQGGLGAGFNFRGIVNPQKPVQFAVVENFERLLRPVNFESSRNTNRDINLLKLQAQWAPTGRSLSGVLHYAMLLDLFESDRQHFANRFQNSFGARVNWQWLPKTRIYLDVTQGVFTGIAGSTKVTSYPLITTVGLQTLLTPLTTLRSQLGYTNGFYTSGPSYSAVVFGAQFGYRYAPSGQISLLYDYHHQDSINANFYRDHQIELGLHHAFVPIDSVLQAGLIFREYSGLVVTSGPMTRSDVLGDLSYSLRYNYRDWLAFAVTYQLLVDQTDYEYMVDGINFNPSYVRHELLAGVRAAY